ncbi:MAG: TonB C-terminal domain-containing protein [Gemmatimonadota bacterium]
MEARGSRRLRIEGNATVGLAGTVLVHAFAIGLLFFTVKTAPNSPPVYAVNLVAAPLRTPDTRPAPEAVSRPVEEETPTAPPPKPLRTQPKPAPLPVKPAPSTVQREPAPRTRSTQAPAPGETPGTGTDALTVKTPGLTFPFPGYLENIYNQIYRRWERPIGSNLTAEVTFLIMRDGSIRDLRFSRSSGNFSFDLSAQGAVEAVGNAKAFGPLPDGFEADVLLVSFYFSPGTGR